jgi:hypothetical protein
MGYLSVGNYIGNFPVWNAARLIPLAECTKTNSGRQMATPLLFLRYDASTAFLLERAFEEARVTLPSHVAPFAPSRYSQSDGSTNTRGS